MPNAEAFLQAILAEPEADGPRLVFADWLDENGDPVRAEFTRVQIALARMPEDDPRRPALVARELELIETLRDRWLREHAEMVAGSSEKAPDDPFQSCDRFRSWLRGVGDESAYPDATFERGMFDWVRMVGPMFCREMCTLFRDWPVRHLWLVQAEYCVRELADWPWPGRVTKLILSHSTFLRGDAVHFLGSPNLADLRELTVAHDSEIDPADVAGLVGLRLDRLESLNFSGGRYRFGPAEATTLAAWSQMSRLTRLELKSQRLGSDGVETLCAPGRLERLTHLSLPYNGITPAGARAVARSGFFGALEVLNLGGNPLGDEGIIHLTRGPHRGRLGCLDLTRTDCGPAGIGELLRSADLRSLTELKLSFNRIGAEGVADLAGTPSLAGLQTLELGASGMNDEWTRALAASTYLRRLRSLHLSENAVGDAGLRALIDSGCLASVLTLELRNSGLGDESARALARWPGLARLRYLGLSQNRIGDAGAEAMANSPYTAGVGSLDLSFNSEITKRGKAAFAAAGLSRVNLRQAPQRGL
jgi:uncharacterized protein (TIGR02996 family)